MDRTVCLMLAIQADANIKSTLFIVGKISGLNFQLFIQIAIYF